MGLIETLSSSPTLQQQCAGGSKSGHTHRGKSWTENLFFIIGGKKRHETRGLAERTTPARLVDFAPSEKGGPLDFSRLLPLIAHAAPFVYRPPLETKRPATLPDCSKGAGPLQTVVNQTLSVSLSVSLFVAPPRLGEREILGLSNDRYLVVAPMLELRKRRRSSTTTTTKTTNRD